MLPNSFPLKTWIWRCWLLLHVGWDWHIKPRSFSYTHLYYVNHFFIHQKYSNRVRPPQRGKETHEVRKGDNCRRKNTIQFKRYKMIFKTYETNNLSLWLFSPCSHIQIRQQLVTHILCNRQNVIRRRGQTGVTRTTDVCTGAPRVGLSFPCTLFVLFLFCKQHFL